MSEKMQAKPMYIPIAENHPLLAAGATRYLNADQKPLEGLGPIRSVNIFVGPNNSGKSRFMRALYMQAPLVIGPGPFPGWHDLNRDRTGNPPPHTAHLVFRPTGTTWNQHPLAIAAFTNCSPGHDAVASIDLGTWRDRLNAAPFAKDAASDHQLKFRHDFLTRSTAIDGAPGAYKYPLQDKAYWDESATTPNGLAILDKLSAFISNQPFASGDTHTTTRTHRHYFAPLRSCLRLPLEDSAIASTFGGTHSLAMDSASFVHTGQDLYEQLDRVLRGNRSQRMSLQNFENWLSRNFFSGRPLALVPRHKQKGHSVGIDIDGEDRLIHEVGDGLQQLIILTFPLFTAEKGSFLFIEEPETHMHPGLQRAFIDVLLSPEIRKRELTLFLTTHSNHLLAAAFEHPSDVSLFAFRKEGTVEPEVAPEERRSTFTVRHVSDQDIRLLDELGAKNSSVFLAQCQVWVEGPSDVIYLRAYLKSLQNEYEHAAAGASPLPFDQLLEDRDYTFVTYGGSLIETLSFAEPGESRGVFAAGSRIFVISDKDDAASETRIEKHTTFRRLAEQSRDRMVYRVLDVREIENSVAEPHLSRALRSKYDGPKAQNPSLKFDLPADELLGTYLQGLNVSDITSYVAKSGTWKDKTALAREVCKETLPWSELRDTTKKLTLDMDAFIRAACGYPKQKEPS